MEIKHELHLVNGHFKTAEAVQLLNELTHTKIRHHMRRIEQHAGSEEDIKSSEKRIRMIETNLRDILQYLNSTTANDGWVDLEGTITIRVTK